jgi:D-alanyl-D-alanine carboxypeptidase
MSRQRKPSTNQAGLVRALAAAAGLVLLFAPTALAQAERVDALVTKELASQRIPGASLVVLKDGKIVKAAGYGVADRQRSVPASPETVYKIGSVSKQFIATGIMLLSQDGRLRVDDLVSQYLKDAPAAWKAITIRHLLTHTSGLIRESPAFDPFKPQPDADVIHGAYSRELLFPPGAKWAYSNLGYFTLAEIIRIASGQSWNAYLDEKVFKPSGMTATRPTTTESVPNKAKGYTDNDRLIDAADWPAVRPSGAFMSTVLDLARWDAILGTDTILRAATRQAMWTPVTLNSGTPAPYGFGWHVSDNNGRRTIFHGGGMPGFTSTYLRFPDERLTVIVLLNSDDGSSEGIARAVAALFLASEGR